MPWIRRSSLMLPVAESLPDHQDCFASQSGPRAGHVQSSSTPPKASVRILETWLCASCNKDLYLLFGFVQSLLLRFWHKRLWPSTHVDRYSAARSSKALLLHALGQKPRLGIWWSGKSSPEFRVMLGMWMLFLQIFKSIRSRFRKKHRDHQCWFLETWIVLNEPVYAAACWTPSQSRQVFKFSKETVCLWASCHGRWANLSFHHWLHFRICFQVLSSRCAVVHKFWTLFFWSMHVHASGFFSKLSHLQKGADVRLQS